jgi:hypothetical protein
MALHKLLEYAQKAALKRIELNPSLLRGITEPGEPLGRRCLGGMARDC